MRRLIRQFVCGCFVGWWFAMGAAANDAWVVRFSANGVFDECTRAVWADDVLFYNRNVAPATVRLLGMSNGAVPALAATSVELPSGRVLSVATARQNGAPLFWFPEGRPAMWVLHLDVPGGVTVESRDEVYYEPLCGAPAEPVRT